MLKKFNPITPARRKMVISSGENISSRSLIPRSLVGEKIILNGRNNSGRITVRRLGGGVKRKYLKIDFTRKESSEGTVIGIFYDPNRTAYVSLVKYLNGKKLLILAPDGLKAGDKIVIGSDVDIKPGNAKKLKDIPVGTLLHNVELSPGAGGQIARSAGVYSQLMAKEGSLALLRLPSGELRNLSSECMATVGQVSNLLHENRVIGSAGKSRHLGIRPHVRGVAMNPIDHPHGGGEGRTSGGRHPVTPWGKPTKGKKTRHNKRTQQFIVKRRK